MAIGRNTGPGKVTINFGDSRPGNPLPIFTMGLLNFNFDGDELKREHMVQLDKRLVPKLVNERGSYAQITGRASRAGDAVYNMELSKRRLLAVRNYLSRKGVNLSQMPIELMLVLGEYGATSPYEDDAVDRSVTIKVVRGFKPRPPKPPEPEQEPEPQPVPVPVPGPEPIEPCVAVPLREVYISKWQTYKYMPERGDPAGKTENEKIKYGRRLKNWRTVWACIEKPFRLTDTNVTKSRRHFVDFPGPFVLETDYLSENIDYTYDPSPEPNYTVSPYELPDDQDACEAAYNHRW